MDVAAKRDEQTAQSSSPPVGLPATRGATPLRRGVVALRTLAPSRNSKLEAFIFPLAIFAFFRLLSAAFLTLGAARQPPLQDGVYMRVLEPLSGSPGYWAVLSNWDGQWYKSIALNGYPRTLPETSGQVLQNEWAFYPGFPILSRALMEATGATFEVAASLVSLISAAIAMVLIFSLVRRHASRFTAVAIVVALCAFVSAPVLQAAYTEGLALLLLVTSLTALSDRRYGRLVGIALCLAVTRPLAPPLAAAVAVHWLWRWRRRSVDHFPLKERRRQGAAVVGISIGALIWPLTAAIVTGRTSAYVETMRAWPSYAGGISQGGWVGGLVQAHAWALLGVVLLVLAAALFVSARRAGAAWGQELRIWGIVYPIYLVVATAPGPSLARYALLAITPLWPFPEKDALPESQKRNWDAWLMLALTAAIGVACQYFWTTRVFVVSTSPAEQMYP